MKSVRLTKRVVDGLEVRSSEYVAWDDDVPSLGIRLRPSGAKSFILIYRAGAGRSAPKRKLTIGAIGKLTIEEARKLARQMIGRVMNGEDPASKKSEERKALTVAVLAEQFLSDHVEAKRKASTAAHYRDILERIVVPEIGTTKAGKVTHAVVARLHLNWKHTPYQANRMLAVLGSMYAFASKRQLVPAAFNPARGIEKYPEQGRERFLQTEEIERLGATKRCETSATG
jgi:hypothetical protein